MTAGLPVFETVPSEEPPLGHGARFCSPQPSDTADCWEKGTRRWKKVLRFEEAAFRLEKTTSCASAAAPSFCMAGRSCSRKPGSLFQVPAMQLAWVEPPQLELAAALADSLAVLLASTMNRCT